MHLLYTGQIMAGETFTTYMFIPAVRRRFLEHAITEGRYESDAFIFDFEDSARDLAHPERERALKASARETLQAFFPLPSAMATRYYLRINAVGTLHFAEDLRFLERTAAQLPMGIFLPKVASAAEVMALATVLDACDPAGHVAIVPMIESPEGLAQCDTILGASPRIIHCGYGHIDYFFVRGVFPIPMSVFDSQELQQCLVQLCAAAKAHHIGFIDSVYYSRAEHEILAAHCQYLAYVAGGDLSLGKMIMHPNQLPVVSQYSTRPPEEDPLAGHLFPPPWTVAQQSARAAQIVQAFETREEQATSVCRLGDRIISPQVYLLAKAILRL